MPKPVDASQVSFFAAIRSGHPAAATTHQRDAVEALTRLAAAQAQTGSILQGGRIAEGETIRQTRPQLHRGPNAAWRDRH